MYYSIDASNGTPIYLQIVQQTKFAVADRELLAGQKIPSVRNLAKQLAVNPNTIQRAFQVLQSEGIIQPQRGLGQIVCKGAIDLCKKEKNAWFRENVENVVDQALNSGVDPPEILKLVQQAIEKFQKKSSEQQN